MIDIKTPQQRCTECAQEEPGHTVWCSRSEQSRLKNHKSQRTSEHVFQDSMVVNKSCESVIDVYRATKQTQHRK